jgi:hypothetical protein
LIVEIGPRDHGAREDAVVASCFRGYWQGTPGMSARHPHAHDTSPETASREEPPPPAAASSSVRTAPDSSGRSRRPGFPEPVRGDVPCARVGRPACASSFCVRAGICACPRHRLVDRSTVACANYSSFAAAVDEATEHSMRSASVLMDQLPPGTRPSRRSSEA